MVQDAKPGEDPAVQKWVKKPENDTIYDMIVRKELKANIIFEDEQCLAFVHTNPVSKIHFVVIPKIKDGLTGISKAQDKHEKLLGHMMVICSKVAK